MEKRISFYVKYSEDFTKDLYNKLWDWSVSNSLGLPRGWCDTYERLKQGHYFLFDNWGLNEVKFDKDNIKNTLSYGVDNNSQCIKKELSVKEVADFINTPSQLLGETEEWEMKAGLTLYCFADLVMDDGFVNAKKGKTYKMPRAGAFINEKERDHHISYDFAKNYFRPARPEEIPQEEVEYVECLNDHYGQFTKGKIYQLQAKKEDGYGRYNVTMDDKGSTTNGWGKNNFKPSTREAYEAQQKHKELKERFRSFDEGMNEITKEVNKCSTINTNQNECKNENKNSKTNDSMDSISGGTGGQEIRLRAKSVRVVCESGFAKSGREVSKTRRSSKRPKAETGRRFI